MYKVLTEKENGYKKLDKKVFWVGSVAGRWKMIYSDNNAPIFDATLLETEDDVKKFFEQNLSHYLSDIENEKFYNIEKMITHCVGTPFQDWLNI